MVYIYKATQKTDINVSNHRHVSVINTVYSATILQTVLITEHSKLQNNSTYTTTKTYIEVSAKSLASKSDSLCNVLKT